MDILRDSATLLRVLEGVPLPAKPSRSYLRLRSQLARVAEATADFAPEESLRLAAWLEDAGTLPREAQEAVDHLIKDFQSNRVLSSMFREARQQTGH